MDDADYSWDPDARPGRGLTDEVKAGAIICATIPWRVFNNDGLLAVSHTHINLN